MIAQIAAGYSIPQIVIALIIIVAVIGILIVVMRVAGVNPPPWVIQIGWIVLVAFVAIFAIRLLVSM
jgi:hypothetical protein